MPALRNSTRAPELENAQFAGPDNRLGSRSYIQLGVDTPGMGFDGVQGDVQFICDFLVGQALSDQLQHALLPVTDRFGQFFGRRGGGCTAKEGAKLPGKDRKSTRLNSSH